MVFIGIYMFIKIERQLRTIHLKLKLKKDQIFVPLVNILPSKITPSQVTFLRFIFILLWLPLILFQPAIWQIAIFIVNSFLDLLDGALARLKDKITYFGEKFDPFVDRLNQILLYLLISKLINYQLKTLILLIIAESVFALLIAIEYFFKQRKMPHWRKTFQFCVRIVLWIVLAGEVGYKFI